MISIFYPAKNSLRTSTPSSIPLTHVLVGPRAHDFNTPVRREFTSLVPCALRKSCIVIASVNVALSDTGATVGLGSRRGYRSSGCAWSDTDSELTERLKD